MSPIELAYYKYFAEHVIDGKRTEKFSGINTSSNFLDRIIELHKDLFPSLESNRMDLEIIRKNGSGLSIYTFRGNVSKLNKKLRASLLNDTLSNMFKISVEGNRGAKFYGIKAEVDKVRIVD